MRAPHNTGGRIDVIEAILTEELFKQIKIRAIRRLMTGDRLENGEEYGQSIANDVLQDSLAFFLENVELDRPRKQLLKFIWVIVDFHIKYLYNQKEIAVDDLTKFAAGEEATACHHSQSNPLDIPDHEFQHFGGPIPEIANLLGVSESTVDKRRSLIRRKIRRRLADRLFESKGNLYYCPPALYEDVEALWRREAA